MPANSCGSLSTSRLDTAGPLPYPGNVGRALIILGIVLVIVGLTVSYGPRMPFRIGRLPGDIYIHKNNTTFYFPIVTCILVSVVLSLVMWIFNRR
jgi:hypothetical protein